MAKVTLDPDADVDDRAVCADCNTKLEEAGRERAVPRADVLKGLGGQERTRVLRDTVAPARPMKASTADSAIMSPRTNRSAVGSGAGGLMIETSVASTLRRSHALVGRGVKVAPAK